MFKLISSDVNECLQTPSVCGPNSVCNNTVRDYNCTCWRGYQVTNTSQKISESNPCTGELLRFENNQCTALKGAVCDSNLIYFRELLLMVL